MIGLTYDEMIALKPCESQAKAVTKMLGGAKAWNGKKITAAQAVAAGVTFNDLVWVASAQSLKDKDVGRRLFLWMADCAARVLHFYEEVHEGDGRVRAMIVATRAFARGTITEAGFKAAADECDRAAEAAGAAWAARAAWAAWDARDAEAAGAAWAARAAEAAWAARDARAAERQWQFARLVARLSDPEPEDWNGKPAKAGAT